jgi:hypothetical protein
MARGLWVPGAVWEFQQNLRALPTTGVQVVQSSTEPTTWQWEYTIQEDDLPLVDTVGRGDVPSDMLYGCLVNFWFLNNSGATQTYNCRVQVQSQTLGTFQSGVATRSNTPNNNYVYFSPLIHSVGVGTTLRVRLWGTAAHDLAGIRLVLTPMVTPPLMDALLLVECIASGGTGNVGSVLVVAASARWDLSSFQSDAVILLNSPNTVAGVVLFPISSSTWRGGMVGWFGTANHGNTRLASVGSSNTTTLVANGLYGVYNLTLRLVDVRFGHLFRNLAGVSKF